MRKKVFLSLAIVVVLVVGGVAGGLLNGVILGEPDGSSPIPSVINYQGTLLNQSTGDPVPDGQYSIVFSIYNTDTVGSPLWNETQSATVHDGLFSVMLGNVTPLTASLFDGSPRYLGVKVEVDAEMTPRQLLASVPYAFHAEEAQHAHTADNVKQLIEDFVVASGESVTAGDVVSFLNGNVSKEITVGTISHGSEYVFNEANTYPISAAALNSTKFVVAYSDVGSSGYGTAVIGDVTGTTISYGSEYVFNEATTYDTSAAALSSTKFVVAYRDYGNSQYGTAVIGDVTGTAISYGSEYVFNGAATSPISAAALSSTKFVVAYSDYGNSQYGTAVIGEVTGTTISYGSEYVFNEADISDISAAALSSTKFVVAYRDYGNGNYGTAVIGDVTGTAISYGSEYVFNGAWTYYTSAAALSSTRFVVAYRDYGNGGYGTAVIGEVTGTTISYGSEYVFNEATTYDTSAAALSSTKFVVAYTDYGNGGYGTAVIGDVTGTTISYGSEYVFNEAQTSHMSAAALSSTRFVVAYRDAGNFAYGTAVIGEVPPVFNCTCGDICVNETGWWRNGGTFNASATPIQSAVNNATAGETICVKDGTYTENVDVNTANLTIQSESGTANCVVQAASSSDHVFYVTENWTNITGFTVKGATGTDKAGIRLSSATHCTVSNNNVTNNGYGIYLDSSSNNTLTNNTCPNNIWAITLGSSSNNNTLTNNTAGPNNAYGIVLGHSSNNTLTDNTASNNGYGAYGYGIYLQYGSNNNTVTNNTCSNNDDVGITLKESSNNNTVTNNTVLNNDWYGIYAYTSSNNNIIYNNYFNNTNNAYDSGTNTWNITKTAGANIIGGPYLGGNYWSDYAGSDSDADGFGDTPYTITGGANKDYLPLVLAAGNATLEGHVNLTGFQATNVTVRFFDNGTVTEAMKDYATTDSNGNFTIGGIIPGTYDVAVKGQTSLSNLVTNVTLTAGNTTEVDFGALAEGDASNDDYIDGSDYGPLSSAWLSYPGCTPPPAWDPNVDFSRDDYIDGSDYGPLSANWLDWGDCFGWPGDWL